MAYQTKTARKPKGRHHNSRRAAAIIISVLVIAGGVFAFLCIVKPFDKKTDNDTNVSQKSDDAGKSSGSVDPLGEKSKDKSEEREKEKENISQYSGENPNEKAAITGNINFSGRSGKSVAVRVTLDQNLGTSAKCAFTFIHESGQVITAEKSSTMGPTTSFCGYNESADNLAKGKWTIRLDVSTDDKQGVITGEMEL